MNINNNIELCHMNINNNIELSPIIIKKEY